MSVESIKSLSTVEEEEDDDESSDSVVYEHVERLISINSPREHDDSSKKLKKPKPKRAAAQPLHWSSRSGFWYSFLALSIGLGNCWRFPIILKYHGGGAYLIPYTIVVVFMSIPLTQMELGLGQFSSRGPLTVWMLCPLVQGLGVIILIFVFGMCAQYNVLMAYCIYYLFASFATSVPWQSCDMSTDKERCITRARNISTIQSCRAGHNEDYCKNVTWQFASEIYWREHVIGLKGAGLSDGLGNLKWDLTLCALLISTLTFVVLTRGVTFIEKTSKYLIFLLFGCLGILLLVSLLNNGSGEALRALLIPNFNRIVELKVWVNAVQQAFLSNALFTGVLIMYGCYSPFRSPCNMDAITINLIDYGTSLLFAMVIFNCMGAMSQKFNISITEIFFTNKPLLYVIIPESLTYLAGPTPVWSILFYTMMLSAGFTTQYCLVATFLCAMYDKYPETLSYKCHAAALVTSILFFCCLIFVTQNGSILLNMFDDFWGCPVRISVAALETVSVCWIYGVQNLADDLHFMLGFRPSAYWQGCWILSPAILVILFVFMFIDWKAYIHSDFKAAVVGWAISGLFVVCLMIKSMITIFAFREKQKGWDVLKPPDQWGPKDPVLLKSRRMFSSRAMTKEYMYRQTRFRSHLEPENTEISGDTSTTKSESHFSDYSFIAEGTDGTAKKDDISTLYEDDFLSDETVNKADDLIAAYDEEMKARLSSIEPDTGVVETSAVQNDSISSLNDKEKTEVTINDEEDHIWNISLESTSEGNEAESNSDYQIIV